MIPYYSAPTLVFQAKEVSCTKVMLSVNNGFLKTRGLYLLNRFAEQVSSIALFYFRNLLTQRGQGTTCCASAPQGVYFNFLIIFHNTKNIKMRAIIWCGFAQNG
jgi:hypothetical protein